MRNIKFILLGFFLNMNVSYSQELEASIKNEMIEFLYFNKELSDESLSFLLKNKNDKNVIVFWYKEYKFSDTNIKAFRFGTSREHSKQFIMLIKGNSEKLFLGVNMEEELSENLLYNFIRFYGKNIMLDYYEACNKEIIEIYKHNYLVSKLNYIDFIDVYKD